MLKFLKFRFTHIEALGPIDQECRAQSFLPARKRECEAERQPLFALHLLLLHEVGKARGNVIEQLKKRQSLVIKNFILNFVDLPLSQCLFGFHRERRKFCSSSLIWCLPVRSAILGNACRQGPTQGICLAPRSQRRLECRWATFSLRLSSLK